MDPLSNMVAPSPAPTCPGCGADRARSEARCPRCTQRRPANGWAAIVTQGEPLDDEQGWVLGSALHARGPVTRFRAAAPRNDGDADDRRGIALLVLDQGLHDEMTARTDAVALIRHAALQPVVAKGVSRSRPFRVNPLPSGVTIAARLFSGKRFTDLQVRAVGTVLAEAIATLHAADIVHGHICPDTVVLENVAGGLAPMLVDLPAIEAGPWLPFVAPEVASGMAPEAAADLFGLGVVLSTMRSGAFLKEDDGAVAWATVGQGPAFPPPPGATDELTKIIQSLLDRDPGRRPSAAQVVADRLAGRKPAAAPPPPPPVAPPSPTGARPAWMLPALLVALVLVGLVGWRLTTPGETGPTAPTLNEKPLQETAATAVAVDDSRSPTLSQPITDLAVEAEPVEAPPPVPRERGTSSKPVRATPVAPRVSTAPKDPRAPLPVADPATDGDQDGARDNVRHDAPPTLDATAALGEDTDTTRPDSPVAPDAPDAPDPLAPEAPEPASVKDQAALAVPPTEPEATGENTPSPAAPPPPPPDGTWRGNAMGRPATILMMFEAEGVVRGTLEIRLGARAVQRDVAGRYTSAADGRANIVLKELGESQPATWTGTWEAGHFDGEVTIGSRSRGRFSLAPPS
jgi:hypothetical protein